MTISVEEQKIIGENLTAELGFCKTVEECFHKKSFGQKILFRYTHSKWLMSFFFFTWKERLMKKPYVNLLIALKKLGWCANYQVQTEKVVMKEFYSRIRVSFPNLSKNRLIKDKKNIKK